MDTAQNGEGETPRNAEKQGGWDDPAGAGVSVMREAATAATPRTVAVGVAHLPAALTDVQPAEFDAAIGLALSRMSARAEGPLGNVRAAIDQSNSVIVLTADVRCESPTAPDDEATR